MITAYVDCTVVVGDGRVLDNINVIVEKDKITKLLSKDDPLPRDANVVSLGGGFLLPGLIDSHVHFTMDGSPDPLTAMVNQSIPTTTLKASQHARNTLMAGFTSVRDLGGASGIDLALRDAINSGLVSGPRMLASARYVCMTGGHGWDSGGREADGPDDVRKAVREQIRSGCDLVKLMATGGVMTPGVEPGSPQLTEEELRAGIEEAHKAGRKTATHAQGSQGILNALRAGIDSIEHGFYLTEEIISIMAENKVAYVPTITAINNIVVNGTESGIPEFAVKKARKVQKAHLESLGLAKQAGILVAMGTDAGTPFNLHGENAQEMTLMVQAGYSPLEAITCATQKGAQVLGLEKELGTIEEGKIADLILVEGDPTSDIKILQNPDAIRLIIKGGRVVKESN
ncbi:MAG: amidohydrolase family protein [Desulfarculaceae bacterium]